MNKEIFFVLETAVMLPWWILVMVAMTPVTGANFETVEGRCLLEDPKRSILIDLYRGLSETRSSSLRLR